MIWVPYTKGVANFTDVNNIGNNANNVKSLTIAGSVK